MILHELEQHSEAWFAIRAGKITGTRFSVLMSGESTKGYQDLITTIAAEIIIERQEEGGFKSADMERGTLLEPTAREVFCEITDFDIRQFGFISPDENLPYSEWVGISPDGVGFINNDPAFILEIKCPKASTHFGYLEQGTLPTEYRHQVQGQLFVSKLPYAYFMSYCEGMKAFIIKVDADIELHKTYEERLSKFILQVQEKLTKYKQD